jgi:hypothetical protein
MNHEFDNIVKLRDAIDRVAKELHLKRESWGLVPSEDGNPDHVVVTFSVDPDIILSELDKERLEIDETFSNMVDNFDAEKEYPAVMQLKDTLKSMVEEDWDLE